MSSPISSAGGTPKGFLDSSRPRQMEDADKIYQKIAMARGGSSGDALEIAFTLNEVITNTKGFELDQLWEKIEKKFNGNRSLAVKNKTDAGKAQTAYSMFYSLLETVDQKAVSTIELQTIKDLFADTELHVANKWYGNVTTQEKRVLERISKTINNRITEMSERFNGLVEEGLIVGNAIR